MRCLAEGATKLLHRIRDLDGMLAAGLVKGEVPKDLQAAVDEAIEELKPVASKVTFILTIPFILRAGSSQLALTLQELVPEEFLGLIHQSVVDEHLHSVHGIELLVGSGGGDTCER